MRVTNRLILQSEKRSFWRASFKVFSFTIISLPQKSEKRNFKVFSFTIISLPQKSEKRNKITNKFRKACGFKIFENWHLLFTLKVGCCWFLKSIARLVNSFRTQDSLFATKDVKELSSLTSLLQPTNTQTFGREEMKKPLK